MSNDNSVAARLTEVIKAGRIVSAEQWDDEGHKGQRIVADTGNGWGLSITRWVWDRPDILNPVNTVCSSSYGGREGLWEVGLTYGAGGNYRLAHREMYARWGDVRGWLTAQQVGELVNEVMSYDPPATIEPKEEWQA